MAHADADEVNNCTIELVHGGTIHVAHSPSAVRERMAMTPPRYDNGSYGKHSGLMRLERVNEPGVTRSAASFREVQVNPNHVAAIYLLDSRSARS